MTDNKYFWTLLNQSWVVSYPLAHKRSSMWASVVAVSTVLLALIRLFSFVFYCENNGPGQCCHHVGKHDYCKITSVRMCDLSAQSTRSYKNLVVRVQYTRTVLMTQFASCALYAVPRVRLKSEVYFGLKTGCPLKLSRVEPGQYLDGRPPGKTRCCWKRC